MGFFFLSHHSYFGGSGGIFFKSSPKFIVASQYVRTMNFTSMHEIARAGARDVKSFWGGGITSKCCKNLSTVQTKAFVAVSYSNPGTLTLNFACCVIKT